MVKRPFSFFFFFVTFFFFLQTAVFFVEHWKFASLIVRWSMLICYPCHCRSVFSVILATGLLFIVALILLVILLAIVGKDVIVDYAAIVIGCYCLHCHLYYCLLNILPFHLHSQIIFVYFYHFQVHFSLKSVRSAILHSTMVLILEIGSLCEENRLLYGELYDMLIA